MNDNTLKEKILNNSESKEWIRAIDEWVIIDCQEDATAKSTCICGKKHLKHLFKIRNIKNKNVLFPIGSTCIKTLQSEDLDFELSIYKDMFKLLKAIEAGEYIELNSEYFSRNLLWYLNEKGAFVPNSFNGFDAENDYYFMLDMFNKKDKDDLYDSQYKKIKAIILNNILPFMKKRIHTDNPIFEYKSGYIRKCPACKANMVVRISSAGSSPGEKFWGCSRFPKCKYTTNF